MLTLKLGNWFEYLLYLLKGEPYNGLFYHLLKCKQQQNYKGQSKKPKYFQIEKFSSIHL